jgi:hypothetical protein
VRRCSCVCLLVLACRGAAWQLVPESHACLCSLASGLRQLSARGSLCLNRIRPVHACAPVVACAPIACGLCTLVPPIAPVLAGLFPLAVPPTSVLLAGLFSLDAPCFSARRPAIRRPGLRVPSESRIGQGECAVWSALELILLACSCSLS